MKIIAIMMDKASNKDTMMQSIKTRCCEARIEFCVNQAQMRCMVVTTYMAIHLYFFLYRTIEETKKNYRYGLWLKIPIM